MIGARARSDQETDEMVHGKSSEAEVGPAQERKTFLNRYTKKRSKKLRSYCIPTHHPTCATQTYVTPLVQ